MTAIPAVRHSCIYTLAVLLLLAAAWRGASAGPPPPVPTLAPMLEKVLPAIVNISTETATRTVRHPLLDDPFFRRFFDFPGERELQRRSQSLGSGVIVDARTGFIMTNHHVIEAADAITVTLRDQRQFTARLIGQDPEVDLALLQIEADELSALPMADSEQLRVGDFVVAIGNPFGLSQTVTYGIVSALGRSGLGIEGYEDFIQTDASINPGNSGGALVNMQGELVGINTAIVGPNGGNVGIGFAIPSNMMVAVREHLQRYGEVRRGELGVVAQDLTPELARAFGLRRSTGAVIAEVVAGSAAERAGLLRGDVIVALNDSPVDDAGDMRNTLALLRAGSRVKIDLLRERRAMSLYASVAEPEIGSTAARDLGKHLSGAQLGPVEPGHPLAGRIEGVAVRQVERGTPAWSVGLRPGDIIVAINRQPVSSLEEVTSAMRRHPGMLMMNIRRGNGSLQVVIR